MTQILHPRVGLTKMVAKLSRENAYRKGLEVFDALPAIGLMPDTAITNAAISACDKGAASFLSLALLVSVPAPARACTP